MTDFLVLRLIFDLPFNFALTLLAVLFISVINSSNSSFVSEKTSAL